MSLHIKISSFAMGALLLAGCATSNKPTESVSQVFPAVESNNKNLIIIQNKNNYVIECSQVIGGYCSRNPLIGNQKTKLLPDPGSNMIRGHIMVYNPDVPGIYVDNLIFKATNNDGEWEVKAKSLYGKTVPKELGNSLSISAM